MVEWYCGTDSRITSEEDEDVPLIFTTMMYAIWCMRNKKDFRRKKLGRMGSLCERVLIY